jgi:hypothetical protein
MKRSILVQHNDGSPDLELEVSKAVLINSASEFIYFDKLGDGTWRIAASKGVITDISKIDVFKMHRED